MVLVAEGGGGGRSAVDWRHEDPEMMMHFTQDLVTNILTNRF